MACVTLKRPLDFDPLEVLHSPNRPPTKRRRCTPIKNVDRSPKSVNGRKSLSQAEEDETTEKSVFTETPLASEEISTNLKAELKRLKHRKNLLTESTSNSEICISIPDQDSKFSFPNDPTSSKINVSSTITSISAISSQFSNTSISSSQTSIKAIETNAAESDSPKKSTSDIKLVNPFATLNNEVREDKSDKKVFSLKEMTMICEKMCKERTDAVRQEYDKILHQKLSEQYDAFVKFIDHQIQQRFNESQLPSYLS